jgi:nicotinamidase-related amidase
MEIDAARTAVVITDPQNDFLSPDGVTWGVVGESVIENNTVENLDRLMRAAKEYGYELFVSPHYYYPTDHGWKFGGALEVLMHNIGMFDRASPLSLDGFEGSGADWLVRYKTYLEDGRTIVTSPHKVYGPETNDLVLQLRDRQGHPCRYVGEPLCRGAHAGASRARVRGRSRHGCDRGSQGTRW